MFPVHTTITKLIRSKGLIVSAMCCEVNFVNKVRMHSSLFRWFRLLWIDTARIWVNSDYFPDIC